MKDQVRLDIPLLLPEIKDEADRCIGRLTIELQGRTGVQEAHVVASHDDTPAQLCIHYDPTILSLERVREIANGAGAALTEKYQHIQWRSEEHTSELQSLMRISYAVFCLKKKKKKKEQV